MRLARLILAGLLLSAPPALADDAEDAQLAELEKLRREVAGEVQLTIYDLLDELVYGWTQTPPFAEDTPVFVADVTVPVGLGTALVGLVENHLAALLLANPKTRVVLSHCPSCNAVLVHSGPEGTVVSRGLDNPEALAKIGGPGGRYGLHLDVSAEGAWLVLRARITRLTPDLPIVWSRTLTNEAGAPSLLRGPDALKSAAEARREHLDALQNRPPFTIPIRFAVRTYTAGYADGAIAPVPVIWAQTGFELALSQARAWTASVVLGYAWLPEAYDGFMMQSRMSRLISGSARSLSGPDVYLFLGAALMTLNGAAVGPLAVEDSAQLLRQIAQVEEVRATFGAFHIGLEARVGDRIGAAVFLENMPAYNDSDQIGTFLENDFIDFHSFGAEVVFCF